ncbi:hypothetical protein ATW55_08820 [Ferroacidibacillus organovorans]|uniref:Uncharacterized protein n=1 Tax=Ferroacidibacillus organovorans TaxID=1765683 RepID=A0A124IWB5_9BACL|nr:hypothetical protein ATW55_08820 [Ferroacidibacillus organovorans]
MSGIVEPLLMLCGIVLILHLYARQISAKLVKRNPAERTAFRKRFVSTGVSLAVACFSVGLLYQQHVVSLLVAGILYIPLIALFAVFMSRLQPLLRAHKEDL